MLSTITPDGMREEVIFTPAGRMSSAETAKLLEAARQALAARGIASPGARDIGAVLVGGMLFTPTGPTRVAPMLAAADPGKPLMLSIHNFAGSPANYRSLMYGLTQGRRVRSPIRETGARRSSSLCPGVR